MIISITKSIIVISIMSLFIMFNIKYNFINNTLSKSTFTKEEFKVRSYNDTIEEKLSNGVDIYTINDEGNIFDNLDTYNPSIFLYNKNYSYTYNDKDYIINNPYPTRIYYCKKVLTIKECNPITPY